MAKDEWSYVFIGLLLLFRVPLPRSFLKKIIKVNNLFHTAIINPEEKSGLHHFKYKLKNLNLWTPEDISSCAGSRINPFKPNHKKGLQVFVKQGSDTAVGFLPGFRPCRN